MNTSAYGSHLAIVVVALLAVAVVGGALLLVRVLTRLVDGIRAPASRLTTYECGEKPVGPAWFRFNSRFTVVALVFLVFDVELALLWPILPHGLRWIAEGKARLIAAEVAVFVAVLALGLVYAIAKGELTWDREVRDGEDA